MIEFKFNFNFNKLEAVSCVIGSFRRATCRNSMKSRAPPLVERILNEQVQTLRECGATQLMPISCCLVFVTHGGGD